MINVDTNLLFHCLTPRCWLLVLLVLAGGGCLHPQPRPPAPWKLEEISGPENPLGVRGELPSPGAVPVYRALEIPVSVRNSSVDPVANVRLKLTLPPTLKSLKLPTGSMVDGQDIFLPELPWLPAETAAFAQVFLAADEPGNYTITLAGTYRGQTGEAPILLSAVESSLRMMAPDLEITVFPPDSLTPNSVSRWRFGAANTGSASATGLLLSWRIPAGLQFLSSPDGHYAGGIVSCNLGSLPPGETALAEIAVTAMKPCRVEGDVSLSARGTDPVTAPTTAIYREAPASQP